MDIFTFNDYKCSKRNQNQSTLSISTSISLPITSGSCSRSMSTNNKEPMPEQQPVVLIDNPSESMQCSDHPYRSNPGGICAFCLQEKLGKLVSSSNTSTPFFSSSAVSNPSSSFSPSPRPSSSSSSFHHKKKHPHPNATATATASATAGAGSSSSSSTVLKRSKSVAPRPLGIIPDGPGTRTTDSPRKKSFWSFLYHQKKIVDSVQNKKHQTTTQIKTICNNNNYEDDNLVVASVESPGPASSSSFGRKVARSKSVGCGSRSFSGDFLERISTGFGDCTLRRVESHRESNKMVIDENARMKERVKCGGIFGGFGMASGSASSYWLSAAEEDFDGGSSRRCRGRSRRWAWAFGSPMRAFRPASSSSSLLGSRVTIMQLVVSMRLTATMGMMINGVNGNGKIGGNGNSSLLAVGS